jgi:hypothetical protein
MLSVIQNNRAFEKRRRSFYGKDFVSSLEIDTHARTLRCVCDFMKLIYIYCWIYCHQLYYVVIESCASDNTCVSDDTMIFVVCELD